MVLLELFSKPFEHLDVLFLDTNCNPGQVADGFRKIRFCLEEELRYCLQLHPEVCDICGRHRNFRLEQPPIGKTTRMMDEQPRVDPVGKIVESGIPCPLPQNPMIKLHTVHLCAHHMVIHLLFHSPSTNVNLLQSSLKLLQIIELPGHCRRGEIRHALTNRWLYELTKLLV